MRYTQEESVAIISSVKSAPTVFTRLNRNNPRIPTTPLFGAKQVQAVIWKRFTPECRFSHVTTDEAIDRFVFWEASTACPLPTRPLRKDERRTRHQGRAVGDSAVPAVMRIPGANGLLTLQMRLQIPQGGLPATCSWPASQKSTDLSGSGGDRSGYRCQVPVGKAGSSAHHSASNTAPANIGLLAWHFSAYHAVKGRIRAAARGAWPSLAIPLPRGIPFSPGVSLT